MLQHPDDRKAGRQSVRLPLSRVHPDPDQPRKLFDWDKLKELAASIRNNGQWVEIIVRPDPGNDGHFVIVDGERRWRAMPLVPGDTIDAVVVEGPLDPGQLLLVQTSLGLTGQRLDPLELGESCQRLMRIYDLTPGELAERLGTSEATISKLLRILSNLAEVLREDVKLGALPFTVAYHIARLQDLQQQLRIAELFKAGNLKRDSVAVEVGRIIGPARPKSKMKSVQVCTGKGVKATIPNIEADVLLTELASLIEAVRRLQRLGLPLESLPLMLKSS